MNSAFERAVLFVGSSWALAALVKATLVTALGLLVAGLTRGKRAALRHALLAGTFGFLLAMPIVSAVAPPLAIVLRGTNARHVTKPLTPQSRETAVRPAASSADIRKRSEASRWTAATVLAATWVAGTAVFLLIAVLGLRQVLRFRRSGVPWLQGQALAQDLAAGVGVRRRVNVLLHAELAGPVTCGVGRPAILLPADAPNWETQDLNRAIVHELEHVARRDWATHLGARLVCAMYWFHPLVWMAWRRLHLEAERACDDAVLGHSEPTAYADQLVAVARRLSAARSPLPAMASRADLASRVNAVLDAGQRRGRAGALCVTAAAAAAAILALTVSPLRIVAAPQPVSAAGTGQLRITVGLVIPALKVTYPSGNPVEGLTANDFEVTEDDTPQAVRFCEFQKADGPDGNSAYYLLGYYSANARADGQFRRINVTVKNPSTAKVEHRAGYYGYREIPQSTAAQSTGAGNTPPPYDHPPVLIFKMDPDYSIAARKAKYQGNVLLNVVIDDSGRVGDIQVARNLGLGLDEKAIESVQQWRFQPATKNGKAVSAPTQVEVAFRLL